MKEFSVANERLLFALTHARAVQLIEQELPALISLAELHRQRGESDHARERLDEVWESAARGPYPLFHADALNVLAQIERDAGNRDKAVEAATKAYELAWCDGISADGKTCYAYWWGLKKAREHLDALGAKWPDLPPFDASQFEPMPEVEINPRDEFYGEEES